MQKHDHTTTGAILSAMIEDAKWKRTAIAALCNRSASDVTKWCVGEAAVPWDAVVRITSALRDFRLVTMMIDEVGYPLECDALRTLHRRTALIDAINSGAADNDDELHAALTLVSDMKEAAE